MTFTVINIFKKFFKKCLKTTKVLTFISVGRTCPSEVAFFSWRRGGGGGAPRFLPIISKCWDLSTICSLQHPLQAAVWSGISISNDRALPPSQDHSFHLCSVWMVVTRLSLWPLPLSSSSSLSGLPDFSKLTSQCWPYNLSFFTFTHKLLLDEVVSIPFLRHCNPKEPEIETQRLLDLARPIDKDPRTREIKR